MLDRTLQNDGPLSALSGADPMTSIPLIERIMALSRSATGALIFGQKGDPDGAVLVEKGRVCWAASKAMGRRLTDLLRAHLDPALGPDALEDIVHRCQADNKPLGESLLERGHISSDALRSALRQQTSEAILFLSQTSIEAPRWVSHRQQRYDARFAFSPVELLVSIGGVCLPALGERAQREIEQVLRLGGSAFAYTWVGASADLFPLAEVGGAGLSVRELFDLGTWATSVLSVQLGVRAPVRLVAALGSSGDAIVTWLSGDVIYVVICQNPASLAHVLGKRAKIEADVGSESRS